MKFKATEEQIKQIAVKAVKASTPVGMGMIHFNPDTVFKPEDFKISDDPHTGGLHLDYVQGRMVKLSIWKRGNLWETRDKPDSEYQSWCTVFPTYEALVGSVIGNAGGL